ncbi:hypothetical protein SE17_25170 [Kouleothrix aurantiaca]|uniref:Uncharacterized protein n=1 Tax=Kouleothrix aurantiaca TaxID=186479 RepID=A0A0P9DDE7_9CHLR|nr:hypothetical protein SE17_25170 [Kouleothrix aurantiaca]
MDNTSRTILTHKVIVELNEEQFLALPDSLDPLFRPALMQLNRDETAVELFYVEEAQALAIAQALAALEPPVAAARSGTVPVPVGPRPGAA